MQTSEKCIQEKIDQGEISALAFFYKLKQDFPNNIIYGKRIQTCADRAGCSYRTARKHLYWLVGEGFIVDFGKDAWHWKLLSAGDVNRKFNKGKKQYHRCTIFIEKGDTLKKIRFKLYNKVLQCTMRQQHYKKDNQLLTRGSGIEHAGAKGEMPESVMLSNKVLAKKLCMSQWQLQQFKKFAHKDFKIETQKPKFLMHLTPERFQSMKDNLKKSYGTVIWYRGCTFIVYCTRYTLNPSTVTKRVKMRAINANPMFD